MQEEIVSSVRKIILDALKEDMVEGDITTEVLIPKDDMSLRKAKIVANSEGVLCGIEVTKEVFRLIFPEIKFIQKLKDGDTFCKKDTLLEIEGPPWAILKGERVALNFLQRLCGIATLTRKFVELALPYGVKILDTRKTTPNLRLLEKYAVKVGGGFNHRYNLTSGILIKDNHIKVVGSVKEAVEKAIKNAPPFSRVEVEVTSLKEAEEVAELGVDVIMLDNLNLEEMEKAIKIIREKSQKTLIEVSGGVTLENVEGIARLRPDFISVGKISHSAPSLDISLKIL